MCYAFYVCPNSKRDVSTRDYYPENRTCVNGPISQRFFRSGEQLENTAN